MIISDSDSQSIGVVGFALVVRRDHKEEKPQNFTGRLVDKGVQVKKIES